MKLLRRYVICLSFIFSGSLVAVKYNYNYVDCTREQLHKPPTGVRLNSLMQRSGLPVRSRTLEKAGRYCTPHNSQLFSAFFLIILALEQLPCSQDQLRCYRDRQIEAGRRAREDRARERYVEEQRKQEWIQPLHIDYEHGQCREERVLVTNLPKLFPKDFPEK